MIGEPVIKVEGLVTRVGGRILHDGLDLELRRGEVVGVVGGSGTGKSVLLRTIIGLNRHVGGRIQVLGQDVGKLGERDLRKLQTRWGVLF